MEQGGVTSRVFTEAGTVLLILCAIWACSWLEVWRDPKRELLEFYERHPRAKTWVSLINKSWLPALLIGLLFLVLGVMLGEKS